MELGELVAAIEFVVPGPVPGIHVFLAYLP